MKENDMDFDVRNAKKLLESYNEKLQFDRSKFLAELISKYKDFRDKSIFDSKLLLDEYYSPDIINEVVSDLGYSVSYNGKNTNYDALGLPKNYSSIIVLTKNR
mgnify:CR=1 FL=1